MRALLLLILSAYFTLSAIGQASSHYHIEKIEFKSIPGDWEGCSFSFTIHDDRTVDYKADSMYCGVIGKHQVIDEGTYNSIITRLNKMNFPKLRDQYNGAVEGGNHLWITYDNGKTKSIYVAG